MARETRAQREARWAAEREEARREEARRENQAHYMPRLMALFEAAAAESFELRVEAGRFVVTDLTDRREPFSFAPEYNDDDWFDMERLYQEVNYRAQQRKEQARKLEAKLAALAKLTEEERKLLGL